VVKRLRHLGNSYLNYGPFWSVRGDRLAFVGPETAGWPQRSAVFAVGKHGRGSRPWPRHVRLKKVVCGGISVFFGPDLAEAILSNLAVNPSQDVFWDPPAHTVIASGCGNFRWLRIDTADGSAKHLPFLVQTPIAVSSHGDVAGAWGHPGIMYDAASTKMIGPSLLHEVGIVPNGGTGTLIHAGAGYDAAWSPDGNWLYYVSRVQTGVLRFRIQHRRSTLLGMGRPHWFNVASNVFRTSLFRVRPDRSDRQLVTSQSAYGFANLTVLPGGGGVVFTKIPTDVRLWSHRGLGLTLARARKYAPVPRIEMATIGGRPKVLIRQAWDPAVQP
jgi:WD40-like Beta Propeller Repeat